VKLSLTKPYGIGKFGVGVLLSFFSRGGVCEKKILSSKYSPNKHLNAAHIVESCPNGLVEHIFVIGKGSNKIMRGGDNQIIHSNGIKELNVIPSSIPPIDITWTSNNSISLKVVKGLEKVPITELAGVKIDVSPN